MGTGYGAGGGGAAEVTSIAALLISFFSHSFPMHWNHPKLLLMALVSHNYVFVYIPEFGSFMLFRASRSKGNYCET